MLYWRPVVPGLNTSAAHLSQARELSRHAHATVFTGLFYREQIAAYYRDHDLPEPYDDTARRKILPEAAEQQVLATFRDPQDSGAPWGPLFRKTSCAVAYAHGEADYNGHYGIRELCDICPAGDIEITERAIIVAGLDEPPRYFLQHGFGYQVHAREHQGILPRTRGLGGGLSVGDAVQVRLSSLSLPAVFALHDYLAVLSCLAALLLVLMLCPRRHHQLGRL